MKVRTLLIGAALGLALCLPVAPGMTAEAAEDTVQITDIEQLVPYVPDAIFRQAVFDAVKDGADGAEGADVEEALYNFRGTVLYNKSNATPSDQKIKDVHGIQYLRNAQLVSLGLSSLGYGNLECVGLVLLDEGDLVGIAAGISTGIGACIRTGGSTAAGS